MKSEERQAGGGCVVVGLYAVSWDLGICLFLVYKQSNITSDNDNYYLEVMKYIEIKHTPIRANMREIL
jgi:hypothetical protein